MSDTSREEKRQRRRHSRRTNGYDSIDASTIDIRIGNRKAPAKFNAIRVSGPRDAPVFQRMVDNAIRSNPRDPLFIVVNGYRPWLQDILETCIDDHHSEPQNTNREVQFSDTVSFPQRSTRRTKWEPWTFIVDQMNVPDVYYWTFGLTPPDDETMAEGMLLLGAWTCGRGAYRYDDRVAVSILFTLPTQISEFVVTDLLFKHLYDDAEYDAPKMDEEGLSWLFLHLYELLTDWQNVIREVERRLDEAEANSRGRNIPVKLRTRTMHKEVDRIYELNEYLRFHSRSFKKLGKLKTNVPKDEQDLPVWDEMEDAVDDLEQFSYYLDSLKERFNNLIELEFNIENANQSDNSRFLSILGTIFLPVSFLASLFGMSEVTNSWTPLLYLYIAIPLFVLSLLFTAIFPTAVRKYQKAVYPLQREHVKLTANQFTMLGDELPNSADVPRNVRYKHQAQHQQHSQQQQQPMDTMGGSPRERGYEGGTRSRSRGGPIQPPTGGAARRNRSRARSRD